MSKTPKQEELKAFTIEAFSDEDLKSWQEFLLPEATETELTRKDLEDIYCSYINEMSQLKEFLATRSKETGYPDRLYARILIQLGETTDQAVNEELTKMKSK